jgi:hypothetical protein
MINRNIDCKSIKFTFYGNNLLAGLNPTNALFLLLRNNLMRNLG